MFDLFLANSENYGTDIPGLTIEEFVNRYPKAKFLVASVDGKSYFEAGFPIPGRFQLTIVDGKIESYVVE